jgi:hypothetical protein
MCFSATASFGASAVLGVTGIIAVAKAKTNPQRLFATIPLIFALQQFTEGLLWLSLKNADMASWQSSLTYIYLVFAMAVWPLWVPLIIRLLEKDARSKRIMNVLVGIGAVVAICVVLVLSIYPVQAITPACLSCPLSSTPSLNQHIHYQFSLPPIPKSLLVPFSVLYVMTTIIAPFISNIKKMKWLGIVFLASYLFAIILYSGFVISVWCFFAALLSFVVLWIILGLRKSTT